MREREIERDHKRDCVREKTDHEREREREIILSSIFIIILSLINKSNFFLPDSEV